MAPPSVLDPSEPIQTDKGWILRSIKSFKSPVASPTATSQQKEAEPKLFCSYMDSRTRIRIGDIRFGVFHPRSFLPYEDVEPLPPPGLLAHAFLNLNKVSFFGKRGYGLIVPNMLGYGGTSKPTDPADYRQSLMSRDLADILDAEGVGKAVVVGHDWGAFVAARFVNFQPERTEAVAFITAGYIPPSPVPTFDLEATFEATRKRFGFEVLGYWEFFASLDAPKIIMDNFDTFFNIAWPDNPKTWKTDFCPLGAMRRAVEGKKALPAPSWMSEEDKRLISEPLFKNGLEAPMCYYKVQVEGFAAEDDQLLAGKAEISQPVFHLDALDDFVGSEETFTTAIGMTESPIQKFCKNATMKRVKVDHWVMMHIPDELNDMLLEWLETF